jgi:type IV secretory pathway protease TraF
MRGASCGRALGGGRLWALMQQCGWRLMLLVLSIFVVVWGWRDRPMLIYNPSPSLPPGLYVRDLGRRPWQVGDLVVLETPDVLKASLPKGYEGKPLLKEIAALPGMVACWDAEAMVVRRETGAAWYPYHPVHPRLQALGCQVLGTEEMLITGRHAQSHDSRYTGPVSTTLLRFRVWPLWTRESSQQRGAQ